MGVVENRIKGTAPIGRREGTVIGYLHGRAVIIQYPGIPFHGCRLGNKIGIAFRLGRTTGQEVQNPTFTFQITQQDGTVFLHAGDQALAGGIDSGILIQPEQLLHQIFVLLTLCHQNLKFRSKTGIFQGKQHISGGNLRLFLHMDMGNGAGNTGHIPLAVNVQFSHAQFLVFRRNGNLCSGLVALIFNGHHHSAIQTGLHIRIYLCTIFKSDSNPITGRNCRLGLDLHSHQAIQGNHRQGPMLQHHILNTVTSLAVNILHSAAGGSFNGVGNFCIPVLFNLLIQIIQRFLDLRDGAHHGYTVHFRHRIPFHDIIIVIHQEGFQLHTGRNGDLHPFLLFQRTAALHQGTDIPKLNFTRQDAGHGAIILRLFTGQHGHQRQEYHNCRHKSQCNILFDLLFQIFFHNLR